MRQLALCCLIFPPLLFGATKERNWKIGKVAADSYISSSEYTGGIAGPQHIADDSYILIIRGDGYVYTAQERHAWDRWCLLIQGEEIHYSQDNRSLYFMDADGYKCRLAILKQEKLRPPGDLTSGDDEFGASAGLTAAPRRIQPIGGGDLKPTTDDSVPPYD